jgi:hypothetical protein
MAGTPGTPTCSARPSTDWSVKTLRLDGTQNPADHAPDPLTGLSAKLRTAVRR